MAIHKHNDSHEVWCCHLESFAARAFKIAQDTLYDVFDRFWKKNEKNFVHFRERDSFWRQLFQASGAAGSALPGHATTILWTPDIILMNFMHVRDRKIMWDELDRLISFILLKKALKSRILCPTTVVKIEQGTSSANPTLDLLKIYNNSISYLLEAQKSSR